MSKGVLRHLPSVTELLESGPLKPLVDRVSHNVVVDGVRSFLDEYRQEINRENQPVDVASVTHIAERIARKILLGERSSLQPVINFIKQDIDVMLKSFEWKTQDDNPD